MRFNFEKYKKFRGTLFIILILSVLIPLSQYNYLLFHVLVELFSIVIVFALFLITWNARKFIDNNYLLLLGMAAFSIGVLDLLHTITYTGMDIIVSDKFYANQLWIATRGLESLTFLIGFSIINKRIKVKADFIFVLYLFITTLIILSIFVYEIFPDCYLKDIGQTKFKIFAEYIIIIVLISSFILLIRKRRFFSKKIYNYVLIAIALTALSEFMFTLYISNYGISNQIGHYLKFISFYLIYKANIETGFLEPSELLYSNLKKSEEENRLINTKLKDEIATKDKFFSIISHDLKNPFNSIIGFSELILNNYKKYDDKKILHFISLIKNSSTQTFDLLQNLLYWSRQQTGQISFDPELLNVHVVFTKMKNLFRVDAVKKDTTIELNCEKNISIFADKNMLETILRNLISNAIKFTNNGTINLSCYQHNDEIILTVKDSGIGMKSNELNKLFKKEEKFSKPGTDNEKGTGLGLILIKELVEQHNGTIDVKSEIGKGSVFTIRFPYKYDLN